MNFLYILLSIFIFSFLIFIHELGHFIVARLCGVKVLEFAIGMGPKLISVKSKKTGTAYSIRMIPIGGFVSMLGESGMEAVQGSAEEQQEGEDGAETASAEDSTQTSEQNDSFFLNTTTDQLNVDDGSANAETEPPQLSAEEAKHAYCNQSVWKRILISLAGPAMNVILGFFMMLIIVIASGQKNIGNTTVANFHVVYSAEESHDGLLKGDYILLVDGVSMDSFSQLQQTVEADEDGVFTLVVHRLYENGKDEAIKLENVTLSAELLSGSFTSSLSERSGLQIGDVVKKVNNTKVHTAHELSYEIINQGHRPLRLTVLRNGEEVVIENVIVPSYTENGATFGNMDFRVYVESDFNVGTILKHTWYRSLSTVKMVFDSLFGLFSGRYGVEAVSGPVGITKTISEVAKFGWLNLFHLVTVISINLGIMNLLPFPALDGGHLFLYAIEVVRRKPVKKEIEGMINFIGLIIILTLAVLIAIKDIITL